MAERQQGSFIKEKDRMRLVHSTKPPKDGVFGPRDSKGRRLDEPKHESAPAEGKPAGRIDQT